MLQHPLRSPNRSSMITGGSAHNQSIKRLWRDLFEDMIYIYYHLFYHLEDSGQLESSNPHNIFAIHYVYVPQINRHLESLRQGYLQHRIRTAGNKSPMQLYILGLLQYRSSHHVAIDNLYKPTTMVSFDVNNYHLNIFKFVKFAELFLTFAFLTNRRNFNNMELTGMALFHCKMILIQ